MRNYLEKLKMQFFNATGVKVDFKSGMNVLSPKSKDNNARFIIMDYFREKCSGGRALAPIVEGRIKVVE